MKKNDYLVCAETPSAVGTTAADGKMATDSKRKFFLARAKKPTDSGLVVTLERNCHFDPKTVEIDKSQIVVNLGQEPSSGVVYGLDVSNLYKETLDVDIPGSKGVVAPLHLFQKFPSRLISSATKGLANAGKRMQEHGLGFVLGTLPLHLELLQKTSKYAGMFRGGKTYSKVQLYINEEHDKFNEYVFLHELAHAVDFYLLRGASELQAEWVRMYMRSIKPLTMPLKEVRSLFGALRTSGNLTDWKASLQEEDKRKPGLILQAIKQAHGVSAGDIKTLLHANDLDTLKGLWPSEDLRSTDLAPIVTEYATVSVKELIAESFAIHITGGKLPKAVTSLVEKSIQYAMGQKNNVERAS